jgi:hypothetical protein
MSRQSQMKNIRVDLLHCVLRVNARIIALTQCNIIFILIAASAVIVGLHPKIMPMFVLCSCLFLCNV